MGIQTLITIMLLAVTTSRGLALVTAHSTHVCNVIAHISGGTIRIIHINPHNHKGP